MARTYNPDNNPDGGIIARPGNRAAHMPRIPRLMAADRPPPQEHNAAAAGADVTKPLGDIARALVHMVPRVLQTELVALDAAGTASRNYRLPFQALAIFSESASTLTLTSSPQVGAAPGPGPGVARIPAGAWIVWNLAGNAWALYGGAAGELVTVTAFAVPQAPNAAGSIGVIDGGAA